MNKTIFSSLLLLCFIFSTQTFFAAERLCLDRARKFAADFERKKTFVGACVGETNLQILNEMKGAESRLCAACYRCSCYTGSFATSLFVINQVKNNRPKIPGDLAYGCALCSVHIASGRTMIECCYSCNEVAYEGSCLARLAYQSYEDRRRRARHSIDEYLESNEHLSSPFRVIDASHPRYAQLAQQRMEMNPTPIRRYSRDINPIDLAEDPTHLQ